jgi:type I restriction enzyme M protein
LAGALHTNRNMNLSSTIKSIQDIMRKDDGVDGDAQRIGQLTWMLFLKVFDQRENDWADDATDRGETYRSPLDEPYRWRNWAAFKDGKPQKPANELVAFVNNEMFPALKAIDPSEGNVQKVLRQVFEDSNNYMKSGTLMLGVIEKLDEAIKLDDFTTRANLGDIYEQILNDLRAAGNAGEFYTPRAITQAMVQLVNPRLNKRERLLDPACGTGGFLTAAIDHLRSQRSAKSGAGDQRAIEESIRGIEKKQLPHLLCTTNLLLHGIDVPSNVDRRNTLGVAWNDWSEADKVECVVTNPPFGGMEDTGVGEDYPADVKTRETADMFLTLIVRKLLKDDGRAAVVLPDGFLFGDGIKGRVKEDLLERCNLHTIIRLPNGVFAPYTGIKTNLLFFTKGRPTETIWFYEHPYPEGYKSYSKTKPIQLKEFDAEKAWWGNEANDFADRVESERVWKIDFKRIKTEARARAQPFWNEADRLNDEARQADARVRYLRDSLTGQDAGSIRASLKEQLKDLRAEHSALADDYQDTAADERVANLKQREHLEVLITALTTALKPKRDADIAEALKQQLEGLKAGAQTLRNQAKDAQAAGDRLYWPIYNLDTKNPNAPAEQSHDPDELLAQYKQLLLEIEETQQQLKAELGAALAHHLQREEA